MYEIILLDKKLWEKTYAKLTSKSKEQINKQLKALEENPYVNPPRVIKIRNSKFPQYRLRVGRYRIIYKVDEKQKRVLLVELKKRDEATYST